MVSKRNLIGYRSRRIGPRTIQAVTEGKPHDVGHQHDDRYYTKRQIDDKIGLDEDQDLVNYYHYGTFAPDYMSSGEILMDHEVARAHTLADNFAGCVAQVGTNPAATWVGDVQLNDISIGTLTISTAGVCTFATTGGDVAVAVGDHVTLIAPTPADLSIERFRVTFQGIA